jgi:multicomponent Na+:H+ antiporter subunit G
MIGIVFDILSWAFILAGSAFAIIGAVGLLRLPDLYARMHAAGITDTLGAGLIVAGLTVQAGFTLVTVKLILIFVFLLYTSPTSTYALANAAFTGGLQPLLGKKGDSSSKPS